MLGIAYLRITRAARCHCLTAWRRRMLRVQRRACAAVYSTNIAHGRVISVRRARKHGAAQTAALRTGARLLSAGP